MSNQRNQIQRYEGVPIKLGARGERSRWQRFISLFSSKLSTADVLATEYAEAKVNEAQADVAIKENQAAELAARVDQEKAKATKAFFDLISEISESEDELVYELKLTKLLQDYPELAQAFHQIHERASKLNQQYGFKVQVSTESEANQPLDEAGEVRALRPPTEEA